MNKKPNENRSINVYIPDFDIVVLGATGLTGKLVVEHLLGIDKLLKNSLGERRWAIAGRDNERLTEVLRKLDVENVEIIIADTNDKHSLERLAKRTRVLLNLAGPYTRSAEEVISACISSGTSYADLSGELPLLRRVIDRFDEPARLAGVQIVQMAGWEAFPADLTTMLACHRAAIDRGENDQLGQDGSGAAGAIESVVVTVNFKKLPKGGVPFNQSVSAGTLASIVEMLKDPNTSVIGKSYGLLPKNSNKYSLPDKLRLGANIHNGRVLEPMVPVAFLNPPIIHRTAAILANEQGEVYQPANYKEGVDIGSSGGLSGYQRYLKAMTQDILQRTMIMIINLPFPVRHWLSKSIEKRLPKAGTGPSDHYLRDWDWTVKASATNKNGKTAEATLTGDGHPGYTATAAIIVEVGLSMSMVNARTERSGCITPALAMGIQAAEKLQMPSLKMK